MEISFYRKGDESQGRIESEKKDKSSDVLSVLCYILSHSHSASLIVIAVRELGDRNNYLVVIAMW